jgi:acyl-CoA thioesterase I
MNVKKDKRVLLIADSLAMPSTFSNIPYESTWWYNIQKAHPNNQFIDKSGRASTSERLVNDGKGFEFSVPKGWDILENYCPDLVIIQLGIVDCSPRYVNDDHIIIRILNNYLPKFCSNIFYKTLKRYSERKPKYARVPLKRFKRNFVDFIERAKSAKTVVFIICIGEGSKSVLEVSPLFNQSVVKYNQVLKELDSKHGNVHLICPYGNCDMDKITADGYHLNKIGHDLVAKFVKETYEELFG